MARQSHGGSAKTEDVRLCLWERLVLLFFGNLNHRESEIVSRLIINFIISRQKLGYKQLH